MIGGGYNNTASGGYSYNTGRHRQCRLRRLPASRPATRQTPTHGGSFVWSNGTSTNSWGDNTFTVRAHGGVRFYTAAGIGTGVSLPAGGGSWSGLSDRAAKENFQQVDPQVVLEKLSQVPVTTWNYRTQDDAIRHLGPVAQDFMAAFGLGEDERFISTVDADGIALAAIQGLNRIVQEKDARISRLESRNKTQQQQIEALTAQNADFEQRLRALEQGGSSRVEGLSDLPLDQGGWLLLAGLGVGALAVWRRKDRNS